MNKRFEEFKALVNKDPFYYARLPWMANEVANGNTFYMDQQFGTHGDKDRAWQIVNQYNGLLGSGMTNAEIMGGLYEMGGESWDDWDKPKLLSGQDKVSGIRDKVMNSGGGMLSGDFSGLREKIFESLLKKG